VEELLDLSPQAKGLAQAAEIANLALSTSSEQVQEYFALFYRGFQASDVPATW
jgi:hypothetical protein